MNFELVYDDVDIPWTPFHSIYNDQGTMGFWSYAQIPMANNCQRENVHLFA